MAAALAAALVPGPGLNVRRAARPCVAPRRLISAHAAHPQRSAGRPIRSGRRCPTTTSATASLRATAASLQPFDKQPPTDHRLAGVQPHAARHADQHRAHILQHEHLKVRPSLGAARPPIRARYREHFAHVPIPLHHPVVEVVVLVEQAAEKADGGQHEQRTEETDTHHQALQLVGAFAVDFHHRANAEQRHEAGQQKEGADAEVDAERQQQEHAQRVRVEVADEADAGEDVA